MFNKSTWFKKKPKVNEPLDAASAKKVISTKAVLEAGDWSTAETLINDLIRRHPNNADCCWLFGRLLANRGQYDAAIFHFKQAISLVDTHADAYCSYGATLGRTKRYSQEEEMYKKCLELNPSHHVCHYNYGCLCEILSDYKNAEKHFKQAIELYSKDANYYVSYGILLKTVRRYEEAQKMFEIAITIDDDDKLSLSNAYYQYGRLLQHMDKLNEAISYLKQACKLNPQNTEYQRILHIMVRSKPRNTIHAPSYGKAKTISPLLSCTNAAVMSSINSSASSTDAFETDNDDTDSELYMKKLSITPGGPDSKQNKSLNDLLYNNDINRIEPPKILKKKIPPMPKRIGKQRSRTEENLKSVSPRNTSLTVIEHTSTKPMMTPPMIIKNDFSDVNAPGAVDHAPNNNGNNQTRTYDDAYFQQAVTLYKNQQYNEAETILKLFTMINPNHEGANRLYKFLSQKMYLKNEDITHSHPSPGKTMTKPGHRSILSSPAMLNSPGITMADINNIPLPPAFESKETDPMDINNMMDPDDTEDVNTSQRDPCQIEFRRFLEDRVKLNKQYPDLYERFEKLGYDDIRNIFDLGNEELKDEIGLKSLHCKTFMRKIKVFQNEANVFREWLKKIVSGNQQYSSMDGLIDRLENRGIFTFEALYRYVFTKDDLIDIIGREFSKISYILWREIENQQKDLMSPTPNPATPAFSTPSMDPTLQSAHSHHSIHSQPATPATPAQLNIIEDNDEGTGNEGNVTNYIDQ